MRALRRRQTAVLDLGRTFLQCVERNPAAIGLVDGEVRLSYAAWAGRIGGVIRGLAAVGVARGDHLLSILQNRHQAATLHWACQFMGVVITPLNWRAKADEIDYCLADSGARVLIAEPLAAAALAASKLAADTTRIAIGPQSQFDAWLADPTDPQPQAAAADLSLML